MDDLPLGPMRNLSPRLKRHRVERSPGDPALYPRWVCVDCGVAWTPEDDDGPDPETLRDLENGHLRCWGDAKGGS